MFGVFGWNGTTFAKLAQSKNIDDLVSNSGAVGGAAIAASAPAAGGGAAAAAEPAAVEMKD
ncbi:60S acidic ribosomal protein [Medicago truncatula]|uniref:60S acidic ribosomal protein n=1 Tax=Medicago truncatula TaxID=3880 RepID=A0A072TTY9_MEDTR|nr:60S acidic ribosomal protein [Medicago truncatula]